MCEVLSAASTMSVAGVIAILAIAGGVSANADPTYPQLIATKYSGNLPAGVRQPAPDYSFVDRTKLPVGAAILSAAKSHSGAVWVITNKGQFRSDPEGKN